MNPTLRQLLFDVPARLPNDILAEYRMQKANLLLWSEDFNNAAWIKSNATAVGKVVTLTDVAGYLYQAITVVAGSTYAVRFGTTAGTAVAPTYRFYDASNAGFIIAATAYTAGDTVSTTVTAPAGCTSIRVYPVFSVGTIGTITIDEIQVGLAPLKPYELTTDNQTLVNSKTPGTYDGQLGSTVNADANDPTWTGQAQSFDGGDYDKLSYSIDAQQDFTVYLVTNVGASNPAGVEVYWSAGSSSSANPYVALYRYTNGDIWLEMSNNAASGAISKLLAANVTSGIRFIVTKRAGGMLTIKDVARGSISSAVAVAANPITLNQMALGCLLRTTASLYSNQAQYAFAAMQFATTPNQDKSAYKYFKKYLAQWGVTLP